MTLTEFREHYCVGREYDSCADSPCRYSNHAEGCVHPMHPKNMSDMHIAARSAIEGLGGEPPDLPRHDWNEPDERDGGWQRPIRSEDY